MTCKGVVRGNVVELEGDVTIPEGTRVRVIPEEETALGVPRHQLNLQEWLGEARRVRAQLAKTSDSVEILHQLRERRASR